MVLADVADTGATLLLTIPQFNSQFSRVRVKTNGTYTLLIDAPLAREPVKSERVVTGEIIDKGQALPES